MAARAGQMRAEKLFAHCHCISCAVYGNVGGNMEGEYRTEVGHKKKRELAGIVFNSKEISGMGMISTMRILRGGLSRWLKLIGGALSYSSTRTYGSFTLAFGLFTIFLNLGQYYFVSNPADVLSSLIVGAVFSILSIPFLIMDRPMCLVMQDFILTDYVFFEFFSIKRMHREYKGPKIPPFIGFIFGLVPSVIELFFEPELAVLSVLLVAFVIVAMSSPEFPMIATLLVLPYISLLPYYKLILSLLCILTFLSFITKVAVGKRVFNVDIYSFLLLAFFIFALVGGIVTEGSETLINAFYLIAIFLGTVPVSNLIVNRRLCDCALKAIIVSSVPIAVLSVLEFAFEKHLFGLTPPEYSTEGISATFSSSASLAAFLTLSVILSFGFYLGKRVKYKKRSYLAIFVLLLIALTLTLKYSMLFLLLGIFVTLRIFTSKKLPADLVSIISLLAPLVFMLPSDMGNAVTDFFRSEQSFSEQVSGIRRAAELFRDNIWFGIGISNKSPTVTEASDGANLLIGLGLELGIFALVFFVFIVILRFRHITSFRTLFRGTSLDLPIRVTSVALASMLLCGIGIYIFDESVILYLFLSVFGILTSLLHTVKKDNDERLGYYSDARTSESSAIDISLR